MYMFIIKLLLIVCRITDRYIILYCIHHGASILNISNWHGSKLIKQKLNHYNYYIFAVKIRVLGSLLSAHLIIKDPLQPFGDMVPLDYDNELLILAHDVANRLLAAFEYSSTQIPYPRVSIIKGKSGQMC